MERTWLPVEPHGCKYHRGQPDYKAVILFIMKDNFCSSGKMLGV